MKKAITVLMVLAIVLSLGASAFADTYYPDGYYMDDYGNMYKQVLLLSGRNSL